MKKNIFLILVLASAFTTLEAQKEKNYKEIFYKNISGEFDDMTVTTNNGWSDKEFTKFKLKIENKTGDFLIYKPNESVIKLASGDVKVAEKQLEIYPFDSDFRIVNVLGPNFLVKNYTYVLSGVYKVSTNGEVFKAEDFPLPAVQNEFTAGKFVCTMSSLTKETDKTEVKFECRYTGDKVGVIMPSKAALLLPDGSEMANEKSKSKPIMITKGKTEKITLKWNRMDGGKATDMQKIKLIILWRGTFTEAEPVKLKDEILEFQIDDALSK